MSSFFTGVYEQFKTTPYHQKKFVDPKQNTIAGPEEAYLDFKRGLRCYFINQQSMFEILHDIGYREITLDNFSESFTKRHLDDLMTFIMINVTTTLPMLNLEQTKDLKNYLYGCLHQGALLHSLQTNMYIVAQARGLILCESGIEKRIDIITKAGSMFLIEQVTVKKAWISDRDAHDSVLEAEKDSYLSRGRIVYKLNFSVSSSGKVCTTLQIQDIKLQHQNDITRQALDTRSIWQKILAYLRCLIRSLSSQQATWPTTADERLINSSRHQRR